MIDQHGLQIALRPQCTQEPYQTSYALKYS